VSISTNAGKDRKLFSISEDGSSVVKLVDNINPYLVHGPNTLIAPRAIPISQIPEMSRGNSPTDGGNLLLERFELPSLHLSDRKINNFIRPFYGADEIISDVGRLCIWIDDKDVELALEADTIRDRVQRVCDFRLNSTKAATRPHRFDERKPLPKSRVLVVPIRSSENRPYLPVGFLEPDTVIANTAFAIVDT
jgi:hypothetical protein